MQFTIASLRGVSPFIVRSANGSSKRLSFQARISRNSLISQTQAQSLLSGVAQRLNHAAIRDRIKSSTIQVCFVSRQDMIDMGLTIPSTPPGYYSAPEEARRDTWLGAFHPFHNVVYINSEDIVLTNANQLEILVHEFLHAFSSEVEDGDSDTKLLHSGIYRLHADAQVSQSISAQGYYLNEGLTEYIRVITGGVMPQGECLRLYKVVATLAQQFGQELLLNAYFEHSFDAIRSAFEAKFGKGAWRGLCDLADLAVNMQQASPWEDLQRFSQFGYEAHIMRDWGYSEINRTRAPRLIPAKNYPPRLRIKLFGSGIMLYTNLSDEELERFFANLSSRRKHNDLYSYLGYIHLGKRIRGELSRNRDKQITFEIVYFIYDGQASAYCFLKLRNKSYKEQPDFLGRTASGTTLLCNVKL